MRFRIWVALYLQVSVPHAMSDIPSDDLNQGVTPDRFWNVRGKIHLKTPRRKSMTAILFRKTGSVWGLPGATRVELLCT